MPPSLPFFFFNDTATTEIYTLSLHDALPISSLEQRSPQHRHSRGAAEVHGKRGRSEEHTSELQSRLHLVCRLLLEKKKNSSWQRSRLNEPGDTARHNIQKSFLQFHAHVTCV